MTTQSETLVSAPHDPTRIPLIVAALKKVNPLQNLEDHEYEWFAVHGTEIFAETGTVLFHEHDPVNKMLVLLKGEIHVRPESGGPTRFIGRSKQITGLLPFSRMKVYGGLGLAASPTWGLEFDRSLFPQMLNAIPSMSNRCVGVLLDRVREVTRIEQQAEKLNALGKLAGNLAHELNNPASAAQRAASGVLKELQVYGRQRMNLGRLPLDTATFNRIFEWEASVRGQLVRSGDPSGSGQAEREDRILNWLREHQVEEPWHIAPELAEHGVLPSQLDELSSYVDRHSISVELSQFASSLRAEAIAEAMLDSTRRIFDLIRAIKDYSYMDQAPIQEIDIAQGLENTLTMLSSRLEKVEVLRDYEPNLPCISAYGGELNQVWTALIENALDAIRDQGQIKLSVHQNGELILIEIWDDGPGIAEELQARIFEPFFTTKAPGSGLGLGLDTVNRIVRVHRGSVTVQSRPSKTCFQVRLPIQQLQAY